MSANAIETLREKADLFVIPGFRDDDGVWHYGPHRVEFDDALAAVEALLEAAKRVDDLSEGPIKDFEALWSACEALHDVIRRVETGQ